MDQESNVALCCYKTFADNKSRWALTWFVGAGLNVLESHALSQYTKFAVAVFTVWLFGLSIGKILRRNKNKKKWSELINSYFSCFLGVISQCWRTHVLIQHVSIPGQGTPGSSWGSPQWGHSPGAPGQRVWRCGGPGIPGRRCNGAACRACMQRWCLCCTFHIELCRLSGRWGSGLRWLYTCRRDTHTQHRVSFTTEDLLFNLIYFCSFSLPITLKRNRDLLGN